MRYKFETSLGEVIVVDDGKNIRIVEGKEFLDKLYTIEQTFANPDDDNDDEEIPRLTLKNGWIRISLSDSYYGVPEYKAIPINHLVSFEYKATGLSGNKSGTKEDVKKYAEENAQHWNSYAFFEIIPSDSHIHDLKKVDL